MSCVLVTGANRGLGLEFARQYAAAGWRVHATTRTPAAPGALGEVQGEVVLHALDVRDDAQARALADALAGERIDVLIHNAGIKDRGHSRAEVMRVNAQAPIAVVEALLPAVARAHGRIVLMSSQMGARQGSRASLGDYGDSKAALNDAFRARAEDWAAHGVSAIVMHPGWVRTEMGGRNAPLAVEDSARGIREVIAALTPEQHGRFLTWRGEEHPW